MLIDIYAEKVRGFEKEYSQWVVKTSPALQFYDEIKREQNWFSLD